MKIGFIGLGEQGAPIVERLIMKGWSLHLWARRAAAAEPLIRLGAVFLSSPKTLGEACDYVGICVMADDDVRQVVLGGGDGVLYGLKPGGIIVIHSTVLPETMRELEIEARARKILIIDAPVTGRASGALAGTMTIMVGGAPEAFERARPVLESFGSRIFLLGPIGSGQVSKLLCNNVCFANQAIGLSALDLAVQFGMDRQVAADVLAVSAGASTGLSVALERLREFGRMRPGSAMPKDQRHFREVLKQNGITEHIIETLSATAVKVMRAEDP